MSNNGTHFSLCPNRAARGNQAAFQPVNAVLDEYSLTHAHPLIGMAALQDSSLWDEIDTNTNVTPVEIPDDKPNGLPQQSWGSTSLSDVVRVRHNIAQDAHASLSASRPLHLGAWDQSPRPRLWSMWCHYSCRKRQETRRGERCRGREAPRGAPLMQAWCAQ